jgi:hypothetical protein
MIFGLKETTKSTTQEWGKLTKHQKRSWHQFSSYTTRRNCFRQRIENYWICQYSRDYNFPFNHYKTDWLTITTPTIKYCIDEFTAQLLRANNYMTDYFQRILRGTRAGSENTNQVTINIPNQVDHRRETRITSFFPWRDVRDRTTAVSVEQVTVADIRQESLC